jgi:4,5-DOPA dioxygenase extradiol
VSRLPTAFVSHGAPTLALEPAEAGAMLDRLGRELPRPQSILVISAHWEAMRPSVSAATLPRTIHDFYGFPGELYSLSYGAPGAPRLAARAKDLLAAAGLDCDVTVDRGLDHGAWVPLRYLYPGADVPVTQLAVSPALGSAHHLELGRALAPLAGEGVLVLGSGGLTHNLRAVRFDAPSDPAPDWVTAFADWVGAAVAAGDADALVDYRRRGPQACRNHPSDEHFLPLLVALGAAGPGATGERVPGGVSHGVLAMDAFVFSPSPRR